MTNEQLKNILFIDIETVSIVPEFHLLSENMQELWTKKSKTLKSSTSENPDPATLFTERGAIYSEFSKVVCISIGQFLMQENQCVFRTKSLCDEEEKALLNNFSAGINRFCAAHKNIRFCGHNIKEFDLPFLCRRFIINGMPLPDCLQLQGKKPWENPHIDTLELWKFGDNKNFTSLALLAEVLGIPSPKTDMDGSAVGRVYWTEHDLPRIGKYCEYDVLTAAKVYLQLSGHGDFQFVHQTA